MQDFELLQEYIRKGSESAFTEIVTRYTDMVYSACLRQLKHTHLAEEASQAVFLILSKKANKIIKGTVLSGWLIRAAKYTAANTLTVESRRKKHEREAAKMKGINQDTGTEWEKIAPFLDKALMSLSKKNRNTVSLRFFQGKSHADIGNRFGISEDAARKRVAYALDKLRKYFLKRRITVSGAVLAALISGNAVQAAPAGLAADCAATVHGSVVNAAVSESVYLISKGVMKMMFLEKVKTAGIALIAAVVLSTMAIVTTKAFSDEEKELKKGGVIILARSGGPEIGACVDAEKPGFTRAAQLWQEFFKVRGITMRPAKKPGAAGKLPVLAFETLDAAPVAKAAGIDLTPLEGTRDESYLLVIEKRKKQPFILVVGKTDRGVDQGAAWLLSKVACTLEKDGSWTVSAPTMTALRTPFFRGREATLCPTGRILKSNLEEARKINYELWSEEKLRRYPPHLKACGFNSVQLMELLKYRSGPILPSGSKLTGAERSKKERELVAPVLKTLAGAAHADGMQVSQYIWGSADGFRWDDPKTLEQRKQRYIGLAETYAKHVDHIITHWKDEGNEGGHVIPQQATVFLRNEYIKRNPKIRVTIDAWANPGLIHKTLQDESLSPKAIGIALERWYHPRPAKFIKKTGRRLGIWCWYMCDFEMVYASHIYTRTLDRYYSALPPEAGQQTEWLSIAKCFHGLPSDINLYVGGQKMWTPKRSLKEIVRDYCSALYGPENAAVMQRAYETVEEGQYDHRYGMVKKDRYPTVHGTPAYTARAKAVLVELEKVKLPAGWKPNFTTTVPPNDYLESLKTSLRTFAQGKYASASGESKRLLLDYLKRNRERGSTYQELQKVVPGMWSHLQTLMSAGMARFDRAKKRYFPVEEDAAQVKPEAVGKGPKEKSP